MKLVQVVHHFPVFSQTFIVTKFLGLRQRGWDVHVVNINPWNNNGDWQYFPELDTPSLRQWIHTDLNTIAAQDGRLAEIAPDIIHFEFGSYAVGRMYLKELIGSKITVNFRGYDINYDGLDTPGYYDEVWQRADGLLCSGHDLWLRAQRRGCPPDKPYVNIPPAIDPAAFDPVDRVHNEVVGTAERPLRILGVGRLVWKKGYEYAMQVVRQLENAGIHCQYRIAGDGNHCSAIMHRCQALNLQASTQFLGATSRSEVMRQMQWADVLLHTAVSEGFCIAAIEAQAMKLPVVCTDADGLRENVAHGQTGFVLPRRQIAPLTEKMALLARDPALRQKMGEAGRIRAATHFNLDDQMDAFDDFFSGVLAA